MRCSFLATTIPNFSRAFGTKAEVDPIRHLVGTAAAGAATRTRTRPTSTSRPARNDGKTNYKLTVKDVPVDAFWSVSLYNAEGYYEKNPYNAYSINSITGEEKCGWLDRDPVRRLRRQDPELPADHEGLELHRASLPAAREILNGKWKFPEPQPAS